MKIQYTSILPAKEGMDSGSITGNDWPGLLRNAVSD